MTKVGHTSCSIFTFCHVANAVAWASCSARDHSLKSQHLAVHSLAVISAAGGVGNAKEMSAPSRGDQPRPSAQLVLSTGWFELQQLLYRHVQPSIVHLGKRFKSLQETGVPAFVQHLRQFQAVLPQVTCTVRLLPSICILLPCLCTASTGLVGVGSTWHCR